MTPKNTMTIFEYLLVLPAFILALIFDILTYPLVTFTDPEDVFQVTRVFIEEVKFKLGLMSEEEYYDEEE